ncbi:MAG: CocE/NonD family hydrolase [Cyclobacteriaceae bacterium]|nr:CocE/NonD family hydrolase [Cyclobacteriaceae bacterium]MCH8517510.1 CocE/NonD family hydrolase [Cyclobacteriaceae bacterium]
MIHTRLFVLYFILTFIVTFVSCTEEKVVEEANSKENYPSANYDKLEVYIEMRDGVKLHTTIYSPKDKSKNYPVLMNRTPYSSRPYGSEEFRAQIGPSQRLMEEGNIIVYQDVRGRWMSEGSYDNMRPTLLERGKSEGIDESTDTYDTVEWMKENLENFNSNVGLWGISYPGFYAAASLPGAHPNIKAVSPQAPIGDFYFDDFHHNGAYFLSYWVATTVFGYQKDEPTKEAWYQFPELNTQDAYGFFMDIGSLKNLDQYYGEDNFFWQQLKNHPDYDDFWQKRSIIPHLKDDIRPAVMTVGGWFDAEDLYGPLTIYKTIEENNPDAYNMLVMGPWSHGDWARERGHQTVGNIHFGDSISTFYQNEIEAQFFNHFLKGEKDPELPEAYVFDTGSKKWKTFDKWPPKESAKERLYLGGNDQLSFKPMSRSSVSYVSDPAKPVPHTEDIKMTFTPRKYMSDDQRFAARRPDVLVFETAPLEEDITLAGEIFANLQVSVTGTDADWVVKLIDVYPHDYLEDEFVSDNQKLSNYHQMVRSEVMRGRYRDSFSDPKPFVPNQKTKIGLQLQDVLHTFKKGHKIQVQVQSTWFPLIDRNPQKYVDNIFMAEEEDFIKATHTVFIGNENDSYLTVDVVR